MKKKFKDLTVAKLVKYCTLQESCGTCPFGHCRLYICTLNMPYTLEEETLEQEIEIPDEVE